MRQEVLELITAGLMLQGTSKEHATYQAEQMLLHVEIEAVTLVAQWSVASTLLTTNTATLKANALFAANQLKPTMVNKVL